MLELFGFSSSVCFVRRPGGSRITVGHDHDYHPNNRRHRLLVIMDSGDERGVFDVNHPQEAM